MNTSSKISASLSEKIDKFITITHKTYEFNGKPVTFQLSTISIFVNARDILKTHFDEDLMSEDGELIESVFSFFKISKFDKDDCRFEVNKKTLEFEIWMSDDCAEAFAEFINPEMGEWCKNHTQLLSDNRNEILAEARAKQDATKKEFGMQATDVENMPDGERIVTYSILDKPIKFHIRNEETFININDLNRILPSAESMLINIPDLTVTN